MWLTTWYCSSGLLSRRQTGRPCDTSPLTLCVKGLFLCCYEHQYIKKEKRCIKQDVNRRANSVSNNFPKNCPDCPPSLCLHEMVPFARWAMSSQPGWSSLSLLKHKIRSHAKENLFDSVQNGVRSGKPRDASFTHKGEGRDDATLSVHPGSEDAEWRLRLFIGKGRLSVSRFKRTAPPPPF